jgi:hypothetical protein
MRLQVGQSDVRRSVGKDCDPAAKAARLHNQILLHTHRASAPQLHEINLVCSAQVASLHLEQRLPHKQRLSHAWNPEHCYV